MVAFVGLAVLITLGQLGGIRSHEPQHLLLQLRIHLVRDRYSISKQHTEIQTRLVFVQHRKNADLE
jgi:hypothetical protein